MKKPLFLLIVSLIVSICVSCEKKDPTPSMEITYNKVILLNGDVEHMFNISNVGTGRKEFYVTLWTAKDGLGSLLFTSSTTATTNSNIQHTVTTGSSNIGPFAIRSFKVSVTNTDTGHTYIKYVNP